MNPKVWLAGVLGLTLCVAAIVVSINMSIDMYGLYHNDRGRNLIVSGDPRLSKYLLSKRYVPDNFDAILLGTSVSENWRTGTIKPVRVYNESLEGGVIVEDRALAERAMAGGRIKLVLLLIQPYLTYDNTFRTVQFTPQQDVTALGSKSLLDAYRDQFSIWRHSEPVDWDEFGSESFSNLPQQLNRKLQKMWAPTEQPFEIDASGMRDYTALVNELHAKNIPIVFIVPPISENLFEGRRKGFDQYSQLMLNMSGPQDRLIDFSGDDFKNFRSDPKNFKDGIHMTDIGAATVTGTINDRLTAWTQGGQLHLDVASN